MTTAEALQILSELDTEDPVVDSCAWEAIGMAQKALQREHDSLDATPLHGNRCAHTGSPSEPRAPPKSAVRPPG